MNTRNVHKDFIEHYQTATRQMDGFYREANEDLEYYLGDQYASAEKQYLRDQRRNSLVFNKIRKIVNLISGYQRTYRMAFRCNARSPRAEQAASQLSKTLNHVMRDNGGYELLSNAFLQGPLKTGLALVAVYHDTTNDPISGDIKLEQVPWTSFFIDPYFTKIDLSDCTYFGRRAWVSRVEAKGILPHAREYIDQIPRTSRDQYFPYLARTIDPMEKDLHRIDEFWFREQRMARILVDPTSGRWHEWPEHAEEERFAALKQAMPQMQVIERPKSTVRFQMFLDDELMYDGRDPIGLEDFNVVPFIGYYDPEYWDWSYKLQGIIRALRDPQTESNRRRSKMLDLLDSQIHSGWIAEEDAVINPEDLYQTGQGKVVWARRNQSDRLHKVPPGDIPQGMFHLAQQMDQDILEIGGINEDMLGQVVRGEERSNALLSESRRYQGLLTLHELFDNYKEAKKCLGQKVLRAIQENYTPHKVQEILREEPTPQFFDARFGDYAITLDEVAMTQTQRQLQFRQLFELKQAGAPIPWNHLLESAPLENKHELMQAIQQQEQEQQQMQQMQQQAAQLEMADTQADVQKKHADVQKTQADIYRVGTQADLDRARAAGELHKASTYADKVEQDRMLRLMQISLQIDQAEQEQAKPDQSR